MAELGQEAELADLVKAVADSASAVLAKVKQEENELECLDSDLKAEAADKLQVCASKCSKTSSSDILRFNIGGDTSFATSRKTLTCLKDTRLAELFSGRWDGAFPRDSAGKIFLDLDPVHFRAMLNWLGDACRMEPGTALPQPETMISGGAAYGFESICKLLLLPVDCKRVEDGVPVPSERMEHVVPEGSLLTPQLAAEVVKMCGNTMNSKRFQPLHRATRDGFSAAAFHARCDGRSKTVVVTRSAGGFVFGGYSGASAWGSQNQYVASEGAFLFRLAGPGVTSPSKHAVFQSHGNALYCAAGYGPTFGGGHDMHIQNSSGTTAPVSFNLQHTYSQQAAEGGVTLTTLAEARTVTITELEVFVIEDVPSVVTLLEEASLASETRPETADVISNLHKMISSAQKRMIDSDKRRASLESKRLRLEADVGFLKNFIDTEEVAHEVVTLNVSGRVMATLRSTLTQSADSTLASKFGPRWSLQDEDLVDGNVFIDANPDYFFYVLQLLRVKRLCGSEQKIAGPPLPIASIPSFKRFLAYYNIADLPLLNVDSTLLSAEYVFTLKAWLPADSIDVDHAELLYRATRDGFSAAAFHARCDGRSKTVVVARSAGGFVFGGYAGASAWGSQGQYVASEGAFLFRLAGPGVTSPSKHAVHQNHGYALYCATSHGPTFGGGHDMYIQNSSGTTAPVSFNLPHTYSQQAAGGGVTLTTLAEAATVTITELEVLSVTQVQAS